MNTEFQINTFITGDQDKANVTALTNGGFLVVWESTGQDGNLDGVYGQRYDNNQQPVGAEFRVNTTTTNNQRNPVSVGLNDGGYVIAWQSTGQDGGSGGLDGIFGQRYDSNGNAVGSEFQINTQINENQWLPALSALNNGGFVAVWQSWIQDGNNWGVFSQRYDSNGNAVGSEFQVNTYTTGNQNVVDVETLNDGSFVVVWESNGQDNGTVGIYGRRFDSDGVALSDEFLINSYSTDSQTNPSISKLNDGGFIVVWESNGQDGSSLGIYGQRYDSNGSTVGSEFQVNTTTSNIQSAPAVIAQNDGGFAVVWESLNQDGSSWGIYGQRYDGNGNPIGTETLINTQTTSAQSDPSIAILTNGQTVLAWQSLNQESSTSGYGIYGKVLSSQNPTDLILSNDVIAENESTGTVIGNLSTIDPDSTTHTYSLVTGLGDNDNSFFTIQDNVLKTNQPFDFEEKSTYTIRLKTDDGAGGSYEKQFTINVSDVLETNIYPIGDPFKVNGIVNTVAPLSLSRNFAASTFPVSNNYAYNSDIAALNGGFGIVWESYDTNNWTSDIYAQLYDNNANPININFQVDTNGSDYVYNSSISGLSNGDFTVVWSGYNTNWEQNIYAQLYDSNGTALGTNFVVNTNSFYNYTGDVASTGSGFTVVWSGYNTTDWTSDIYAQRYDNSGTALGTNFVVDINATYADSPAIAGSASGDFTIVWSDYNDVYGQRYDSTGMAVGTNFQVDDNNYGYAPSITYLTNGGFVITWNSYNQSNYNSDIFGQLYNSSGVEVGGIFQVDGNEYAYSPSITALADGGFTVVYNSYDYNNWVSNISGQRFDSNGNQIGNDIVIAQGSNTNPYSSPNNPSVTTLDNNHLVFAWDSYTYDYNNYSYSQDVYGQLFGISTTNTPPSVQANKTIGIQGTTIPLNITVPTDIDNDPLTITVDSIPNPDYGVIKLGTTTITAGSMLSPTDFPNLVFEVDPNIANASLGFSLSTDFSYSVSDGLESTSQVITLANSAPYPNWTYPNSYDDNNGNPDDLVLPSDYFIDPEGDTLTYTASISANDSSWLAFDPDTATFIRTGVPSNGAVAIVTVIATDFLGLSGSRSFQIIFDEQFGIRGRAIDNYITNGTVFFDVNNNGILDSGELSTTTDENGFYSLALPETLDLNGNGELDADEGTIVLFGGIDTATGLSLKTPLKATPKSTVLTLLTSLVADLVDQGLSVADANNQVTNALGLPANVDLNSLDPIQATNNNQPGGVETFAAMVQVQNVITQIAGLLDGASSVSNAEIVNNVVSAITSQIEQGTPLNLTNTAQLQTIIETAGTSTGVDVSALSAGVAEVIAEANERIDDLVATSPINTLEEAFAQVQKVALGETTQDLEEAGAGTKSIADVVAENTGTVLDTQIANAVVLSEAPTDIGLTNATIAENLPVGNEVGTLTTIDPDVGETHTYSLAGGLGDTDNAKFEIVGDKLLTKEIFDFESQNSYSIRVLTSDGNGGVYSEQLTINVTLQNNNIIVGTEGNDTLSGTEADELIQGLGGKDILKGNGGNDTIQGGAGNDQIYGNAGADLLEGGAGSDRYVVDINDTVNDSSGTQDGIYGSINLDLANYTGIENLTLLGNGDRSATGDGNANKITGNDGNNLLIGNGGNDRIQGKNGNDTLIGGQGNDTLVGGSGLDFFQFNNHNEGIDRITDFNVLEDTILINGANFSPDLVAGSTITPAQLRLGASATTADHRFIYYAPQGILGFDADGVGGNPLIQIAKLTNIPGNFSEANILVI